MENFLYLAETEVNAAVVIFNILFVLVLELIIAWVYKKTHRSFSYAQSFIFTMILMGLIATVIMMVIAENIVGAFALLGAFSLIRFRTIVKETRDIAFIFFALAIGVAGGTNNYIVAGIGTILISLIILFFDKINFGSAVRGGHLLLVVARFPFDPSTHETLRNNTVTHHVINLKTLPNQLREYTIGIRLKNENLITTLVDTLRKQDHVESVELLSGKDAVEY
ncbi:MAG: hypothetical protein G01um101429_463 [Parcubacteria group bacterium Gr01-1014_29]|nr:MAG: hypothetical protein G01um101429_463 [Parcubacteria group bacterium Gr01-1014_29]